MTEPFIHGVQVIEVTSGLRTISVPSTSIIGLLGVAQYADPTLFPLDTPVSVTSPTQAKGLITTLPDDGEEGSLYHALQGIFDQVNTAVVVVRVENEEVLADQLTALVGESASGTGAYAFLNAQSLLGLKPKILIATGWTHQQPTVAEALVANPVVSALTTIAAKLRAVVVADGPNDTNAAAIAKATLEADQRVYAVDPWIINDDLVTAPASARVAGLIAQIDQTKGYWWSPSNQVLAGVVGLGRPIRFDMSDSTADSNVLNGSGVATVVNSGGFRLWGNRNGSADPNWIFLSVRRTADAIYDAMAAAYLWAMDRPFSGQLLDDIANTGNAFMRSQKALGATLGGKVWLDPDLNTAASLQGGEQFYDFDFQPPAPLESLSFQASLNDAYYDQIVSSVLNPSQSS